MDNHETEEQQRIKWGEIGIEWGEMSDPVRDGEFFGACADMLDPDEIVRLLDRLCWQEQLVGVYQILHERFRDGLDPETRAYIAARAKAGLDT